MTATTEAPVDLVAAATARHEQRQRDEAAAERDRVAAVRRLVQRCAANGDVPAAVDGETAEWESVREHQAAVRQRAWLADLQAAQQERLGAWTADQLEVEDHRRVIDGYVRALGPGARVRNLLLVGNLGNGKSTTAIAAGHLAVERGLMTRFVSHQRYLAMLRPDGAPVGMTAEQVRHRYRIADVVILDDLGAELDLDQEAAEFVRRETVELLGDRLNSGRATIITTNLSSDHLDKVLGPRIMSRVGADAHVLRFTGPDRRAPQRW